jgi:uncharacterized protein YdiU (UPF0061 family)
MAETKHIQDVGWNLDQSYASLPPIFYTIQKPVPVRQPELVILNHRLASSLGLNPCALQETENVAVLAGNSIPEGAVPIAQAYAGHQFGHFTMLGDGRAILIGEQITPLGKRFDLQLKGSGITPYSRGGDGRAALGPMLREYIISEAMHCLKIPTTRSLAVVATGETIMREKELPGAVLTRVASSHLRVGTFQYAASWGNLLDLRALADYAIQRHFPEIELGENRYLEFLRNVIARQAELIAKWQLVGFVHGVMNTDNMTISGETIDYGPCAFMDTYDPATVFSSIDLHGRYAYGRQPSIAQWNLARFAETLLPLLAEDEKEAVELAENAVSEFSDLFQQAWLRGMRRKLGLFDEDPQDEALIEELLTLMYKEQADYTNTFLSLTYGEKVSDSPEFADWHKKWQRRLARQEGDPIRLMKASNPALIPRNHRVEEALAAAVDCQDYKPMEKFLAALEDPYAHTPEQKAYSEPPPPSPIPYRTFCGT